MRRRSSTRSSSGEADLEGTDGGVLGPCAWLGGTRAGLGHFRSPHGCRDDRWPSVGGPEPWLQLLCRHSAGGPPSVVGAGRRSHPPVASTTGQSRPGGAPPGRDGLGSGDQLIGGQDLICSGPPGDPGGQVHGAGASGSLGQLGWLAGRTCSSARPRSNGICARCYQARDQLAPATSSGAARCRPSAARAQGRTPARRGGLLMP